MRISALLPLLCVAACASQPGRVARTGAPSPAPAAHATAARPSMYSYWAPQPFNKTYPSYVPDRIDGSYQGTAYLTSTPNLKAPHWWKSPRIDDALCPHTRYGVIEIGDHVLYYAYAPNLIFNAPVTDDGTIVQTIGTSSLTGKIRDGRLTFNVITPVCTTRFFGDFKLNQS